MNLAELRIFRAVVREGGVTRAALHLHRVQSNVTTRVQQLEDDLGTKLFVRARAGADGVEVATQAVSRVVLRADTIPMTHWNRAILRAPLFEARDGAPARPKVTPRGAEAVALADGRTIPAERFSLTGDIELDEWYDADGRWVAMRTTGRDGSIIEYRGLGG